MSEITHEQLKKFFTYHPDTGYFTRNIAYGKRIPAGSVVGNTATDGGIQIKFGNRHYCANRLAWFYVTGKWPCKLVDHKNRIRSDNRWSNLRLATNSQNTVNARLRSDNRLGVKGVHAKGNRFRAQICVNQKVMFLGSFGSAQEASSAYEAAALHYFGEFSDAYARIL